MESDFQLSTTLVVPPFQPNTTTLTLHATNRRLQYWHWSFYQSFSGSCPHIPKPRFLHLSIATIQLMSALRSGLLQELVQGTTVHPTTGPVDSSRFHAPRWISIATVTFFLHISSQLGTVRWLDWWPEPCPSWRFGKDIWGAQKWQHWDPNILKYLGGSVPGQVNSCWFALAVSTTNALVLVRLCIPSTLLWCSPRGPPPKNLKGAAGWFWQWLGQISSCYVSHAMLVLYLNDMVFNYPFTAAEQHAGPAFDAKCHCTE